MLVDVFFCETNLMINNEKQSDNLLIIISGFCESYKF